MSGGADYSAGQRGLEQDGSEPRFLVIGQIAKPHGVKGEVRVIPYTDLPQRFSWLEVVYVGESDPTPAVVERSRAHKTWIILKLAGYDSREEADALRGELLQVPMDDAIPLEEDEYFLFELLGLNVATEAGEILGSLVDVIETGANNVFVVEGARGEFLIPDIPEVVVSIDFAARRLVVAPMPGLFDA